MIFDARVVHHDVEATKACNRSVDQLLQVRHLADIGFDPDDLVVSERAHLLLERLSGRLVGDPVDHDARVALRQCEDYRLADPAVSTGDDRDSSVEGHCDSLLS